LSVNSEPPEWRAYEEARNRICWSNIVGRPPRASPSMDRWTVVGPRPTSRCSGLRSFTAIFGGE
jgi:hypothetical protein